MKNVLSPARIGAAFVVAPAVIVLAGGPALAADSVSVSNTETVQAHLDASGHVRDARVYEQLALQGHGTVTVSDPVSTRNLRNLDGFGGFDVKGANLVANVSVDGERRLRAVSDFTKELPLKVTATYTLDGKKVEPGDVVGRSGLLQVHYVVENITGRDQEVSFDDGTGTKVTRTEKVVIPMVGSLTTVLPSTFTDVRSDEAAVAGDGHGGTKMTFTMTLFGPIGSPRAEFGYAAKVTDGVVPAATVSALPVSPLDSPSFKGGAASYKGGADTGLELTSGATQIDSNVLKLRDGAAQLLAGLIKLRDGAKDLSAGLSGKAAPGAAKLATGAGALKSGTGKLAKGSQDLAHGATLLDTSLADYQSGLSDLSDGIKAIPSDPGYQRLLTGIASIQAAIGSPSDPTTLRGGLAALKSGVTSQLQPGVAALTAGVTTLKGEIDSSIAHDVPQLKAVAGSAKTAAQTLAVGNGCLNPATGAMNPAANAECPNLLTALQSAGALVALFDSAPGTNVGGTVLTEGGLLQKLGAASAALDGHTPGAHGSSDPGGVLYGLGAVSAGIDGHAPGTHGATDAGGLQYGLNALIAGTDTHAAGAHGASDPGGLAYGLGAVHDGVESLVTTIVDSLLGTLGTQDSDPETTARGAAAALNAGAHQVAEGAGQLASGAGKLDSGAGQLKSGADQLSAGLGDAATGSGKLAAGLDTAAGKAPALEDGASRLSAEGTTKLVDAGKGTAADYGLKYALIEAGAQRAKAEGMAYGAPAGAAGATAYSLELAGMTGEGSRNVGRGLGAVAVFGLGAGLTVLRRRWL